MTQPLRVHPRLGVISPFTKFKAVNLAAELNGGSVTQNDGLGLGNLRL